MFLLTILMPLISAILCGFFSRVIGRKGAMLIATSFMIFTFVLCIVNFCRYIVIKDYFFVLDLGSWITFGHVYINWTFLFDSISIWMFLVVSFISTCVHVYSISYMETEPHQPRFFAYLSLFTFFMFMLISAGNYFQLFVGWEGVGLCSYLLIAFWYHRIPANKAALKAIYLNKLGDFAFLFGMLLIFYFFESLDFLIIFKKIEYLNFSNVLIFNTSFNIFFLICLFLFIAAIGKSAQIGLHTWLPDAMEGPTPVSALIHSATMVTAGVFLIIRSSFLFEYAPNLLVFVTFIGALTAVFAASAALFQNDIKKIIAYSTCSQLGYMVFACGLSAYTVSFFHLVNHAFFKALLFLCAGSVIHALNDEQDIRKMGGLLNYLPLTYVTMFIASLSLAGFPFLTGFYSKDVILEVASISITAHGVFSYWFGLLTVFFTAFYSFRLITLVFLVSPQGYKQNYKNIHEMTIHMAIPMFLLAIGSVFFGYFFKDFFIGLGTPFFNDAIFILPEHSYVLIDSEFIPFYIKNIPFIFTILAIGSVFLIENFFMFCFSKFKLHPFSKNIIIFFNKKWFFDLLYNEFIGIPFLKFCFFSTFKSIDKGFLEFFGPFGLKNLSFSISNFLKRKQTGSISDYLSYLFIFTLFFLGLIEILYYVFVIL